jgi:hypothetical protein
MKIFLERVLAIVIVGILAGCSQDTSPNPSTSEPAVPPAGGAAPSTEQPTKTGIEVGIGDVEAQFWWALQIAEDSLTPSITYNETQTRRDTIAKAEITVMPPYPKSLVIQSSSRHTRAFDGHAIRVDVNILLNEESVLQYSYITGAKAMSEWHVNQVDIMPYLDGTEESVLIRGEALLTMFKDVDESTITMDTPLEGPNVYSAKKLSNIVRVYLK